MQQFSIEVIRTEWHEISSDFVKIILLKSDNCALALRKRLFCDAKPTLLPCKTAAFRTQNNRFCNALMVRWLSSICACENIYIFLTFLSLVEQCIIVIYCLFKKLK